MLDTTKLTDPEQGVSHLLKALASWDEAAELQTYENCEKALFSRRQMRRRCHMSIGSRLHSMSWEQL